MRPSAHRASGTGWWRAGRELLALLVPVQCPGCGAPDVRICPTCRACFTGPGLAVEQVTGSRPPRWPAGLDGSTAAVYAGPVRSVLHAWKDRGRHDLTAVVAACLAGQLTATGRACAPHPLVVVPVPSSAANVRRRGGDLLRTAAGHAVELAAGRPGVAPLRLLPALRQRPRVADQRGLDARARATNIRGSLRCVHQVAGCAVVLVDDVVTTGASTAEAARVLQAEGAEIVTVLTVAAPAG